MSKCDCMIHWYFILWLLAKFIRITSFFLLNKEVDSWRVRTKLTNFISALNAQLWFVSFIYMLITMDTRAIIYIFNKFMKKGQSPVCNSYKSNVSCIHVVVHLQITSKSEKLSYFAVHFNFPLFIWVYICQCRLHLGIFFVNSAKI